MRRVLGAGLAASVAVAACSPSETALTEDTFREQPELDPGCIAFAPGRLELAAAPDAVDRGIIRIENTCSGFLELRDIRVETGDPFELSLPRDLVLSTNESADLEVAFNPLQVGRWTDRILMESNDVDLPVAEVNLTGVAE